ncbi:MAG: DNA polymerase I [Acidimicrobiaceae bacterium]|nr:DNA polymerase I [Acidimicrobiaceae bacterium]
MAKLLVLDGFSLAFRAFFALPETMITSSGQYTNAIHGFTSMLLNLVKDHQPTHIAVAFDHPDPTFRDKLSPQYKGTRKKTPESLLSQIPLIGQVIESLGIVLVEAPGFEADDVIATIAEMARKIKLPTIVVSGDRDSFQLVSDPYVQVLYNRRGVSDYELLDSAGIERRMGVKPEAYPEFAALRGDPSDNIPGVPGVGEKTAAKLINEFGSVEELLKNLDGLPPKLMSSLSDYRDQLRLNLQLIPLVRDVPIHFGIDDFELGEWDPKAAEDLFGFLEFSRIWQRTLSIFGLRATIGTHDVPSAFEPSVAMAEPLSVKKAGKASEVQEFLDNIYGTNRSIFLEVAWSGAPGRSEPRSLALALSPESGACSVLLFPAEVLGESRANDKIFRAISDSSRPVNGVGLKEVLRYQYSVFGRVFSVGLDGSVAGYLLDPSDSGYGLDALAAKWLDSPVEGLGQSPTGLNLTLGFDEEKDESALVGRIGAAVTTVSKISAALTAKNLADLYNNIEKPLISVLAKMEARGILVDKEYLSKLQREFASEALELHREIQEISGSSFNVNSTQQLGKVLFEKLGLQPLKRTKTGFSTDARSLERLVGLHPIIGKIMRYREVEKLRSTYGESLISEIAPDGRIHASFSQTVARTGRLSSDHPNLHNIPIRTEDGRRFRNAFIAPVGRRLIIADYSQIELRVIAHLSKDPGLLEAFANGIDIHRQTASYTFGVPLDEVTSSQRNKAKMVAYGLAYGMEAYGLSQRLGISVPEADEILKAFFAGFPKVSSYMKQTVEKARTDGFTTTEFGRIRPLPELSSRNFRLREAAERQAMNAGIQGLAADIFKIALVKLDEELAELDGNLVLQVHDEVLVECDSASADDISALVKRVLEGAVQLSVPLDVNVYCGMSWADAK